MPFEDRVRVRPGQSLPAAVQTAVTHGLFDADRITSGGDVGVVRGANGTQVIDGRARGHLARLKAPDGGAFSSGNAYAHVAVVMNRDGTTTDATFGGEMPWGTTTSGPAWEANGRADVPANTVVWLRPVDGGWAFEAVGGGGGSDDTFLAVLTYKTYADPFITYSWREVIETGFPGSPLVYTTTAVTSGDTGSGPAFEEDNRDLPVLPTISPATTGDPGPGVSVDQLCVVRLRRQAPAAGGVYYLFNREPWADLFRRTGISDEYGEIAYHRYWTGSAWADGREVRLVSVE